MVKPVKDPSMYMGGATESPPLAEQLLAVDAGEGAILFDEVTPGRLSMCPHRDDPTQIHMWIVLTGLGEPK